MEKLTAKEAAAFLDLQPSYLYKLTSARKIPFYKPSGKRIYFLRTDLESWLFSVKIKSVQELEREIEGGNGRG